MRIFDTGPSGASGLIIDEIEVYGSGYLNEGAALFLRPTEGRVKLERRLDGYGRMLQVWIYFNILDDRELCQKQKLIPMAMAVGYINQQLLQAKQRHHTTIVVSTAEALEELLREVVGNEARKKVQAEK